MPGLMSVGRQYKDQGIAGLESAYAREDERDRFNKGVEQAEYSEKLSGAASGAAIGTQIMPGWGTLIGAGVGLLASNAF